MLTLLSDVKPQDISAVMQVSGSLRLLVKEPDQLTSKAQVLLMFNVTCRHSNINQILKITPRNFSLKN